MFSDASFRANDGKAGLDFAISFNGVWVHTSSCDGAKVSSSKEAEARAILCVLKEARLWGFRKIHLLFDAGEVIRAN